ncbi:uncharacterized protein LOC129231143 [Uloborus diversus]|uniref:uncharacterized protein LOC129231143 n=1 Tax=Uloborus diversus TaxID=327109 RepID=UPI002409A8E0|nr:uncharacterized protein LOC129231143 [Uloborus diversus]
MDDFSHLSPAEYEKISNVLKRDRELRNAEEARIRQLKQELVCLRKRAALKPGLDPLRNCARCLTELGRILNRGALCPICLKKVCKDCRHYGDETHEWLCIYCFKQMQLKAISGEWMHEFSRLSIRTCAKETPADQVRKVLHESQRKGLLESDVIEKKSTSSAETPPQKPPRIFTYEQLQETVVSEASKEENVNSVNDLEASLIERNKDSAKPDMDPIEASTASPRILPRVSPWNGIDPEPTIPVRVDKSRPFGTVHEFSDPSPFRERQSSDEGHCTIGYRSRSTSSEIIDESENLAPVPLPRKRLSPLKKQQAVPEPNPVDHQQSSVDTTDSGVCSPGLKAEGLIDANIPSSPRVAQKFTSIEQDPANFSSNRPSSFAQHLASESSLSESDKEQQGESNLKSNGILFRKVTLRKRKSTSGTRSVVKKHSIASEAFLTLFIRYAHRKLQKSQKCRTVSFDSKNFSSTDMLVRSVSVPNFKTYSQDWLQSWMWKCHSLEDWLWYLEDQPCRPRDVREIASMLPSDYKLVYVSSTSSDSDISSSECYSDEKYKPHFTYSRKLAARSKDHLKVHSRLKVKYGTSYVDDSDWEFQSDESDNIGIISNRKESPTHSYKTNDYPSSSTEATRKIPDLIQLKNVSIFDAIINVVSSFSIRETNISLCSTSKSLRSRTVGCVSSGEFRHDGWTAVPLGDANAFHYSLFPPCCKPTNRGNDSSATGWGKARCCIAVETQRVIDLNLGALDYACEVLDSADLTLCLGWTAAKLGVLASVADAFFYGPPVIPKPEAEFSLTTSDPCLLSLRSRRMIAGRSEGTGVVPFDKVENDKTCSSAQSKEVMQSKRKRLFSKSYQLLSLENDSPWLKGRSRRECKNQDSTEKRTSRLCLENVNKHCLFTTGSTSYSDSLDIDSVIDVKVVDNNLCVQIPLKENENAVNKMDLDYMDQEILPYIKNIFCTDLQDFKSLQICKYELPIDEPILYDCYDLNERVDCQCHKPCDVPSSPSVIDATIERTLHDDGEVFSSGDELDKLESDTDSQDTVIEGEAYKRIRSVAIKEKILHANEELFGASAKDGFESSNETCVEQISQNDVSEQQMFTSSDESTSLGVIFSLDKHFQSFKGQTISAFHPVLPLSFAEQKNNDCHASKDENNVPVSYQIAFNETICSSESSDNGSDGEEVILSDTSTSSDEATYISPAYGFQFYHHPASYRLHTIAEESCEESEKSSRGATPTCKSVCDFEYFDKVRLSSSRSPKKMHRKSPVDGAAVSPISEHKNGKGSPSHSVLASSRLEKYFKSGIFESNHASYHDDDLTDESGGLSSDEEVSPVSSKEKIGGQAMHEKLYDKYFNSKYQVTNKNEKELSNFKMGNFRASNVPSYHNAEQILRQAFEIQMLDNPVASASQVEKSADIKQSKNIDHGSDDEAAYIMNHLMQHITDNSEEEIQANPEIKDVSPMIKILESEIARLMLTVSPASLSAGEPSSSCSSTIGSNNSDYGSDTLESAEDTTSDEEINAEHVPENRALLELPPEVESSTSQKDVSVAHNSSEECPSTSDSIASEETLYICKQLMASLKKIANVNEDGDNPSDLNVDAMDDHSAKQYITNQIVSLMQTVSASQHNSPLLRRLNSNHSPTLHLDSDASQYRSDSDSPAPNDDKRDHSKSKTPSESGSETTISASISIPSYDDSDRTPTESEISHEMDELYALLESNGSSQDVIASAKLYDFDSQSLDKGFPLRSESSLLYGAASKLESLLPISIEERIARYKDAFLNKMTDNRDSEYKSCETRINVILPQPPMLENEIYQEPPYDSSLPPSVYQTSNFELEEANSLTEQTKHFGRNSSSYMDNIEENNYNVTSVKIISHNTYPLSSAIHKILSNNIDSTYLEKKLDYKIVNIQDASEDVLCETAENTEVTKSSDLPIDEIKLPESSEPSIISPLPKVMNPKEKASSENDLLVANYRAKSKGNNVFGTKSVGNITELENIANKSTFRDTGYYSFKSSEESFLSLDDSTASQTSTTSLTQYRSLTSTETIPEEEETCTKVTPPTKMSLSSSNIPDAISDTSPKSSTLPLSLRNKFSVTPGGNHRTRSSFFSTSGVLRKLTLLRDESGNSLRSSPHGRLRMRNRSLSGGSEDDRHRKASLPQIAVSECTENQVGRLSAASSEKESSGVQEDDLDQAFAYHCRSQMSLSSFGGRSESVTSVYSAAGGGRYGTVIVTGEVLFGLNYNYKTGTLEINIKECRNLAAVDTKRNRSDPYVKVYLLPDRTKSGKRKTKVKKHTLSPVFDELLKFHVTVSELEIRTLWLSVWHSDRFGRNDFLGEVMLPLGNDAFDSTGLKWYPLQERMEALETPVSYKGDLILALKYVPPDVTSRKFSKKPGSPAKGALEVLVREARNLMATRSNGTSDPFCKSYLLPDKSKAGKQKTPVFKKSCNPKWNHTFLYDDVSVDDLRERCLELTIWDYDKITSNDFLGGVRLCLGTGKYQGRDVEWMDSVGEEQSLWYTMLERPNTWVDGSLLLRPTMQSRRTV